MLTQERIDQDVDAFLEHVGVKGMHWGVRGTRRAQKVLDRTQRIAKGKASTTDKILGANRFVFSAKGANKQLQRGANQQAKIKAGKMKVGNALVTAGGIKIKNLDYHKTGDANAKMDRGQKIAASVLIGIGALKITSALANR